MSNESIESARGAATARPDHRRRRARAALTILLALGLLTGPGLAQAEPQYTAARKIGRGFANVALGFLAIPGQMMIAIDERGPGAGIPLGFGMGLGMFVASEIIGVFEILTCPFEVPPGFRPIFAPEFPWDYFAGVESTPAEDI